MTGPAPTGVAGAPSFTVLFVCTGNLFRSVLAAHLLAARAPGLRVHGAGTHATGADRMPAATARVLAELGLPQREFATGSAGNLLIAAGVAESDLVLGMTRAHRDAAVRLHPAVLRRAFTLREFLRLRGPGPPAEPTPAAVVAHAANRRGTVPPVDAAADAIPDPAGEPYPALRACGAEIDADVTALARVLGAERDASSGGAHGPASSAD